MPFEYFHGHVHHILSHKHYHDNKNQVNHILQSSHCASLMDIRTSVRVMVFLKRLLWMRQTTASHASYPFFKNFLDITLRGFNAEVTLNSGHLHD